MDPITGILLALGLGGTIGTILGKAFRESSQKPESPSGNKPIPDSVPDIPPSNPLQDNPAILMQLMDRRQRQVEFYSRPGPLWQNNRNWELGLLTGTNPLQDTQEDTMSGFEPTLPTSPNPPQMAWRYDRGQRHRVR